MHQQVVLLSRSSPIIPSSLLLLWIKGATSKNCEDKKQSWTVFTWNLHAYWSCPQSTNSEFLLFSEKKLLNFY